MKTQNYNVAIIDDEEDGRGIIELLLKENFPNLTVTLMAEGVAEATRPLVETPPHILFLDVEMDDGTGFDLLSRVSLIDTIVIFVTAHHNYAIKAIKASAFDYILKPINLQELKQAVNRALGILIKRETNETAGKSVADTKKIALPTVTGLDFIDYTTILYCEADDNYTTLYFTDKKSITVSRTLASFEKDLQSVGFFRIHHKYLVNLSQLKSYNKGKGGGSIILSNKKELEVSVRKKGELLKSYLLFKPDS
jgi:two-component system, LytTR family, response regulator